MDLTPLEDTGVFCMTLGGFSGGLIFGGMIADWPGAIIGAAIGLYCAWRLWP